MHFADMNSFIHNNPMKAFYFLHFPDKNIEAQNIELSLYFPNRIDRVLRTECFLRYSSPPFGSHFVFPFSLGSSFAPFRSTPLGDRSSQLIL